MTFGFIQGGGGNVRYDGTDLIGPDGTAISGIPTYTWAGKPAASATTGRVIGITNTIETNGVLAFFLSDGTNYLQIGEVQTTLAKVMAATVAPTITGLKVRATDVGITGRGILYVANGSTMILGQGRQLFYSGLGTRSAPLGQVTIDASGTGTNGTHLQVSSSPQIVTFPANLLPSGSLVTVESEIYRSSGTNTAAARGYIGTDTVTPGNANTNQQFYGYTFTGSNKFKNDGQKFYLSSTTRIVGTGWSDGSVSTSDAAFEGTTKVNAASTMYLSFCMVNGTLNEVWDYKYIRVYLGA